MTLFKIMDKMFVNTYRKLLETNADKTCVSFEENLQASQLLCSTLQAANTVTGDMFTADKRSAWTVEHNL